MAERWKTNALRATLLDEPHGPSILIPSGHELDIEVYPRAVEPHPDRPNPLAATSSEKLVKFQYDGKWYGCTFAELTKAAERVD